MLPLERLDAELVGALAEHCPIVFLVTGAEAVAPEVAEHGAFQDLALGVDDDRAERALIDYEGTLGELA